jgi:Putative addiction module component
MTVTVDRLFQDSLLLSDESRLKLAERIVESVEPDESIFTAQVAEALRRDREMDEGLSQEIPGEDALRSVREEIRQMAAR